MNETKPAPVAEEAKPMISMRTVDSSQIAAIGHDPETNTMAVQFKKKDGPGSTYTYAAVTADQFAEFVGAESIGQHFGANFKKNPNHPYQKIS